MQLVIFGWGNVSRGDDGIGPLLLSRIGQSGWDGVTLIEDYQLQLEHALDLEGAELALFIDAGKDTPAPFSFQEIFSKQGMTHTSHALAPESVLAVFSKVTGKTPPPAFLLCVRGENFELGAGLSAEGAARLEQASDFLQRLRQAPEAESWRALSESQWSSATTLPPKATKL
jgi:hydrogenase maturation protease